MCAKHFIATFFQVFLFIIINTYKYNTIICEQVLCQSQTRINHIQPVSMKATVAFGVLHHTVTFFIKLTTVSKVFICVLGEVILIHKVVTRVVRRVNVNHLDFSKIGFLQEFQHFKVVTLDIEVFGGNCFIFTNRTQRLVDGCIGKQNGLLLVRPSELIAFLVAVHHLAGNLLHQHILINRPHNLAALVDRFRHRIGKHRRQLLKIFISLVRCLHFQFVHFQSPLLFLWD